MAETAHAVTLSSPCAGGVARGVSRLLIASGMSPLLEFMLPNGRRLDVAAVSRDGSFVGVEIKVSVADFAADMKWPDYLPFCDFFYLAVPPDFPQQRVPAERGLIVADRFGGAFVRESARTVLHASRRRALIVRFAQIAAFRLARRLDPAGLQGERDEPLP